MPGTPQFADNGYISAMATIQFKANTELELADNFGQLFPLSQDCMATNDQAIQILDRYSNIYVQQSTGSLQPTTLQDPSTERRWLRKPPFVDIAVALDRDREVITQVGLRSPLIMLIARALRRYRDEQFLKGFFGDAITGADQDVKKPFKATNVIAADFGQTAGNNVGLTTEKLIELRRVFKKNFAGEGEYNIILRASEMADLLKIQEYTSIDFNKDKVLPTGELMPWIGFNFIMAEIDNAVEYPNAAPLVTSKPGVVRLPVWHNAGMARNTWIGDEYTVGQRLDLKGAWQALALNCCAATRVHEDRCMILEVKA